MRRTTPRTIQYKTDLNFRSLVLRIVTHPSTTPYLPMSPFNCVSHRASLEKLRNYTATAAFISDIGWKPEGYGHVLCNTSTRDDTICIMVGKVSSSRLNTSPIGNHNREYEQPFSKAKFQFTLVTPDEPALINDFQASIAALEKAQAAMAASEDSAHMVLHQGNERSVRFSAPIFSKRVRNAPFHIFTPAYANFRIKRLS